MFRKDNMNNIFQIGAIVAFTSISSLSTAAPIYLNSDTISVSLGSSMSADPFVNRSTVDSLASIIDATTASDGDAHSQSSHIWVRGPLELDFDFGMEYDLTTLHFWNYFGEAYDVDNIDFNFFDSSNTLVGSLLDLVPALGSGLIFAEDFSLSFLSNIQFVNAVLTGSNGEIDFQNIGFTGELSVDTTEEPISVPEPSSIALLGLGLAFIGFTRKKKAA